MIFLLAGVLLLAAWRSSVRARREGWGRVAAGLFAASGLGLAAGLLIGVWARVGMWAIAFANGGPTRFSLSGTFLVVVTFAGFGLLLGVIYEGAFRELLRRSGLAYGLLLTLVTWYPLAQAAEQELTNHPTPLSLFLVSGLLVASMWLPYAWLLERLLGRRRTPAPAPTLTGAAA